MADSASSVHSISPSGTTGKKPSPAFRESVERIICPIPQESLAPTPGAPDSQKVTPHAVSTTNPMSASYRINGEELPQKGATGQHGNERAPKFSETSRSVVCVERTEGSRLHRTLTTSYRGGGLTFHFTTEETSKPSAPPVTQRKPPEKTQGSETPCASEDVG